MNTPDKRVEEWEAVRWRVVSNVQTGRMSLADAEAELDKALTQYHQDLMSEVEKKVLSALEDRLVEEDGREIVGFQQEDQGVRVGLGMAKRIVREVFIKSK